jgi:hypothetical protein
MRHLATLALLVVTACTSDVDEAPLPTACKRSDRTGTYRETYTAQNGDCGPLDSQLVSYNAPPGQGSASVGNSCTVTSEVWSEGDCKLERTVSCKTPDGFVAGVGVSRQQTADGSRITGTISIGVRRTDGRTCSGTYSLTSVRQ